MLRQLIILISFTLISAILGSCGIIPSGQDPALKETSLAISIQQTVLAIQAQDLASQPDLIPQATLDEQVFLTLPPAEIPQIVLPSETAFTTQQAETTAEATQTEIISEPSPTITIPATISIDPETLYENAKILLYEDIHQHDPTAVHYYRDTLQKMGVEFTDVGSAKGNFKAELYAGPGDGKPWDLVIIAAENHGSVPGEFFDYAIEALNRGSSIIMEAWFMDKTYKSSATGFLGRCGVDYDLNWIRIPPQGMVMYAVAPDHPILQEPNSGLKFTNTTSYWAYDYDVGDLMQVTDPDRATILVGTKATEKNAYGTITVCEDGRIILQTFTSHNLGFQDMRPVIENYVFNALRARIQTTQ